MVLGFGSFEWAGVDLHEKLFGLAWDVKKTV
jgi:hypothetical protein